MNIVCNQLFIYQVKLSLSLVCNVIAVVYSVIIAALEEEQAIRIPL